MGRLQGQKQGGQGEVAWQSSSSAVCGDMVGYREGIWDSQPPSTQRWTEEA